MNELHNHIRRMGGHQKDHIDYRLLGWGEGRGRGRGGGGVRSPFKKRLFPTGKITGFLPLILGRTYVLFL